MPAEALWSASGKMEGRKEEVLYGAILSSRSPAEIGGPSATHYTQTPFTIITHSSLDIHTSSIGAPNTYALVRSPRQSRFRRLLPLRLLRRPRLEGAAHNYEA